MQSYYNENYKGYEINILADEYPPNPFEDWDGEPPIAYTTDRSIETFGDQDVNVVPYFDRVEFFRALPAILRLTDKASIYDLVRTVRTHSTDLLAGIHWELSDAIDNLPDSDRLESLCDLYNAIGIPAVCKAVRGYSQGDYAEVLAVATPEFQAERGCAPGYDWHKSLEGSIKLFQDWAYGNVWGYEVTSPDGKIDSCFGYYGDYGALSEARAAIDASIRYARKQHIELVKTWIRNRVPLTHRTAMI